MESWGTIDVSDAARQVQAPTLVMHARDEVRVPAEESLRIASLIPGARFVPLDSRNHLLRPDEPAWDAFLAELDAFLA
jgi:pimeloyl-ACP methyl ester carboxylesterase